MRQKAKSQKQKKGTKYAETKQANKPSFKRLMVGF